MLGQRLVKTALVAGALVTAKGFAAGQPAAPLLQPAAAAGRQVIVEAVCVAVRPGFDARCGLTAGGDTAGSNRWTLTEREARLFCAAFRADPGLDVLGHCVAMACGDTGSALTVPDRAEAAGVTAVTFNGSTSFKQDEPQHNLGGIVLIKAKPTAGGQAVRLALEVQQSNRGEPVVVKRTSAEPVTVPSVDVRTVHAAADVPLGGAVVVGGLTRPAGRPATEVVWLFMPTVVAADQPVPAKNLKWTVIPAKQ